jgi:hypothetical protein
MCDLIEASSPKMRLQASACEDPLTFHSEESLSHPPVFGKASGHLGPSMGKMWVINNLKSNLPESSIRPPSENQHVDKQRTDDLIRRD